MIVEVLKTVFVVILMIIFPTLLWYITMPKKHKEVLGGPFKATKRIVKYGLTGKIDK